jgi:hypothetical protein
LNLPGCIQFKIKINHLKSHIAKKALGKQFLKYSPNFLPVMAGKKQKKEPSK